jgi:hypothetical protein
MTYQLLTKKELTKDWEEHGKPNTDRIFLEAVADAEVKNKLIATAQVVEVETDTTVYWI